MTDDYDVGYGRPPRHTRFAPDRSGNPAGRPRGPQTLARDLIDELQMEVSLGDGAAQETLSTQRAILRALIAKAIEGDAKATATVLDLAQRLIGTGMEPEAEQDRDDPRERLAAKIAAIRRNMEAQGLIEPETPDGADGESVGESGGEDDAPGRET